MRHVIPAALLLAFLGGTALAGQAPGPASAPDVPVGPRDRFYTSDQFSNTVSVIDPAANKLLGVIRLGDTTPANLSPLYRGQLLVHGMGFSPDRKTLLAVSIGSNSVSFIDTATNTVRHTTYVGRSPHEAFFTPDGREVWVSVRGEDYVAILDAGTGKETGRITVPNGPGMTIFSPDGRYGYVCSSFSPETVAIDVKSREIVGRIKQESPFCPDIAATPDGKQVWFTSRTSAASRCSRPRRPSRRSRPSRRADHQPRQHRAHEGRAVRLRDDRRPEPCEGVPHRRLLAGRDHSHRRAPPRSLALGRWNADLCRPGERRCSRGDRHGQQRGHRHDPDRPGAQGVAYVPEAVPEGAGAPNLQPLGAAGQSSTLTLAGSDGKAATQVTLFDQGVLQTLQAAVTGLTPKKPYVLALSADPKGAGPLEPLAAFMTNPAGAAIVNAIGPIRQVTQNANDEAARRSLIIVEGKPGETGATVQTQALK